MEMKSTLTTALVAVLMIGAGPNDKKPVAPVTPEKAPVTPEKAPATTPDKKPATTDTFEDEPTDAPVKKDAVAPGAPKTGAKVLVLPFQPIYRSVAQAKIQTANDLLLKEL